MTWYLGITSSKQIRPFPGSEKCRSEFAEQKQLEEMGGECHVTYASTFKRVGKCRHAEPVTEVLTPNYIFADVPADLYARAATAAGLCRKVMAVPRQESEKHLPKFFAKLEANNTEALRLIEDGDRCAMCQFKPVGALEILSVPFCEMMLDFKRMVQATGDRYPMVEGEVSVFGRATKLRMSPLDGRRAG